ncbi:hypothetical protein PYCC9005_004145 [Savitreella phatthalungensis]
MTSYSFIAADRTRCPPSQRSSNTDHRQDHERIFKQEQTTSDGTQTIRDHDDVNARRSISSSTSPSVAFDLIIRQQPDRARVCSSRGRDRRNVDPPPIIQLRISQLGRRRSVHASSAKSEYLGEDPETSNYLQNPYLFMCCVLVNARDERPCTVPASDCLSGTIVSSLFRLKDPDSPGGAGNGGFFIFADISMRLEGVFRLKFSLFEAGAIAGGPEASAGSPSLIAGGEGGREVSHIASVVSQPFQVYSAKTFPGMSHSTLLSRSFSDQGVRIRIRKEAGAKGAGGNGGSSLGRTRSRDDSRSDSDDDEDGRPVQKVARSYMPPIAHHARPQPLALTDSAWHPHSSLASQEMRSPMSGTFASPSHGPLSASSSSTSGGHHHQYHSYHSRPTAPGMPSPLRSSHSDGPVSSSYAGDLSGYSLGGGSSSFARRESVDSGRTSLPGISSMNAPWTPSTPNYPYASPHNAQLSSSLNQPPSTGLASAPRHPLPGHVSRESSTGTNSGSSSGPAGGPNSTSSASRDRDLYHPMPPPPGAGSSFPSRPPPPHHAFPPPPPAPHQQASYRQPPQREAETYSNRYPQDRSSSGLPPIMPNHPDGPGRVSYPSLVDRSPTQSQSPAISYYPQQQQQQQQQQRRSGQDGERDSSGGNGDGRPRLPGVASLL